MPTLAPHVAPKLTPGGGGRGPTPRGPRGGGGGGGGRGDGDRAPDYTWRLSKYRMGLFFTIASITMIFMALTTLYMARRAGSRYDVLTGEFLTDWIPVSLPIRLLLCNTAVLLLSSFTVEKARRAAVLEAALIPASRIPGIALIRETSIHWVRATTALGFGFLAGQWFAWRQLAAHGTLVSTGPASSFVYILTGAHAVHLAGGLIVLVYACVAPLLHRSIEARRITIDVTAIYWHYMGALWIYILALLCFLH